MHLKARKAWKCLQFRVHSPTIFFFSISSSIFSILSMHHIIYRSMSIFPQLETPNSVRQESLFWPKKDIYSPPPFLKMIFIPLTRQVVFQLLSCPFCLNSSIFCINFTLLLPIFSFSFPFLTFSFTFPPFFSSLFHIFSTKWHWLISPPRRGESIFQYCCKMKPEKGTWDF